MVCRFFALLFLAALPLHATIVATGDGLQNLSAPADDFGWSNVGTLTNGTTAVYLGNGWMITAYHTVGAPDNGFNLSNVNLAGTLYTAEPNSGVRLHTSPTLLADLALFRLTSTPNLPAVQIASALPTNNLPVVMMGFGPNRAADLTYWDVDHGVWTEGAAPGDARGYRWAAGQALRWGTNNILAFNGNNVVSDINDGFGITTAFRTRFGDQPGEAQAGSGDSGGGVFWKINGEWQLGGIMLAINSLAGQPGNTAVFGNETYSANLSSYREEILSIIPEPVTPSLALIGLGLLAVRRTRNRGES